MNDTRFLSIVIAPLVAFVLINCEYYSVMGFAPTNPPQHELKPTGPDDSSTNSTT
jgi:hypothetical protein